MAKLIVVIPSRKDDNLMACRAALRLQDPDVSVLVVDDGLERPPSCAIPGVRPFCFARNVNIGIMATGGAADVILLNDDAMLVSSRGFTLLQEAALAHPEFGVVSAAVKGPSNSPEHGPRDFTRLKELHPEWDLQSIRTASGFTIPFVCVFIPRSTINRIGMLDERFGGYVDGELLYGGDDDDYCYRTRREGLKIGIFDGCVVDHASLVSTFRPHGGGLSITAARKRFQEIHGFEMATR